MIVVKYAEKVVRGLYIITLSKTGPFSNFEARQSSPGNKKFFLNSFFLSKIWLKLWNLINFGGIFIQCDEIILKNIKQVCI
jgi:hypothetical protein